MKRPNTGHISGTVMVLILMALVWQWFSQPAVGHQEKVSLAPQTVKTSSAPKLPTASSLDNSYFNLSLPAGYTPQSSQSPGSGLLFSQTIIKPSASGSLIINIGISILPTGGLTNNSSYRLRAQQPQAYTLSNQTIDGSVVSVATRSDGASGEVVAFWQHANYLGTISVTSGIGNADIGDIAGNQAVLSQILQLWQWR